MPTLREKIKEEESTEYLEKSYPSDKEAMRPVRKSEAGKYEGMEMPEGYMKMPDTYMKDVHSTKKMKKKRENMSDSIGTDVDGPPRKKHTKKRTY